MEYCEWCGDEIRTEQDGPDEPTVNHHVNVDHCVALCEKCGGFCPEDERYEKHEDDRCQCTKGGE